MKKIIGIAIMAIALAGMCGTAMAWDANEHLSIAPNGKGDVLIIPQYVAMPGGWATKVTVINTCDRESVVAKVVVRSGGWTKELLDFFIYLSPSDVWTGIIDYAGTSVRMFSTDDSIVKDEAGNFATPTDPFNVNLQGVCPGDAPLTGIPGNQMGYVTVVQAWNFGGTFDGVNFGQGPVPKEAIKAAYEDGGVGDLTEVANVLAGHYEISNFSLNWYAANDATVIQNANVRNPLELAVQTRLGDADFRNNFCEFEAVLAKNRVAMHYYSGDNQFGNVTVHFNNFPTKYTQVSNCEAFDVISPFFLAHGLDEANGSQASPYQYLQYGLIWYDLSENTPTTSNFVSPVQEEDTYHFPYEVNITEKIWSITFDEGWANYEYDYTTNCTAADGSTAIEYTGAPVIPTTMYFNLAGMALHGAAWSDGTVVTGTTFDPLYRYDWEAPFGSAGTTPIFCETVNAN